MIVNIEVGQNMREVLGSMVAYLAETPTFSWWDTTFGTAIGCALISDYMMRGGKSPAVFLGLTYVGLMMKKSRLGFISMAAIGTMLYWNTIYKNARDKK